MYSIKQRLLAAVLSCSALSAIAEVTSDSPGGILPQYVNEAEALKGNPKVQKAFEYIIELEPQSEKDLVTLTEIEAPPFMEDERAAKFAEMLKEAGLKDVTIDEVGNVIGRRPGKKGGKVLAYAAHLDTVFPKGTDVKVKYVDGKMYAPGIGDDTRGLVVVLGIMKALDYAGIETEGDVWFIGNVGEEGLGDLRGVKHLFRDGAEKIDAFISVDGGRSDRIVYGGVGSHRYRVIFSGPGGHSWGAFGLANPHHALGRTIALFDKNGSVVSAAEGQKVSYNIGRIGGGTSINSIPFESWMEVDMRSGDQSRLDDMDAVLHASAKAALEEENAGRLDGPELSVEVRRVGTRPAGLQDVTKPLLQKAMAATKVMGYEPSLQISSTDSNLPISKGIPAVTMSRGGIGGEAHSPQEWWQNVDGHHAMQIGILTILSEVGIAD